MRISKLGKDLLGAVVSGNLKILLEPFPHFLVELTLLGRVEQVVFVGDECCRAKISEQEALVGKAISPPNPNSIHRVGHGDERSLKKGFELEFHVPSGTLTSMLQPSRVKSSVPFLV